MGWWDRNLEIVARLYQERGEKEIRKTRKDEIPSREELKTLVEGERDG